MQQCHHPLGHSSNIRSVMVGAKPTCVQQTQRLGKAGTAVRLTGEGVKLQLQQGLLQLRVWVCGPALWGMLMSSFYA